MIALRHTRLRREFGAAEQPRRVEAMARAACFSRRQFHRLMLQVLGDTPGAHQRRLRLDHRFSTFLFGQG
jgi:transcriptional regulator GlxA family with amidase domain